MGRWFKLPLVVSTGVAAIVVIASAFAAPSRDYIPHLLSTVIGVTGVTIPLIILYRSEFPDVRQKIARRMEQFFASVGIAPGEFKDACLSMHTEPLPNCGKLIFTLESAYRAHEIKDQTTDKYEPFPEDVKGWFFGPAEDHKWWFNFLMDAGEDRPVALHYLFLLVVLGLTCAILLYVQYLNFIPPDLFQINLIMINFFVSMTFFSNVAVYIVLGVFAIERNRLDIMIGAAVTRYCPEVVRDLKAAIERIRVSRAAALNQ